jgi:hypothetical protein
MTLGASGPTVLRHPRSFAKNVMRRDPAGAFTVAELVNELVEVRT